MIKGYLRLPYKNPNKILVRFTKQFGNGHIQLYDVIFPPYDWHIYPATIKMKNTLLGEYPIKSIRKEIKDYMNSWNFRLKQDDEMSEEELDYYYV